MIDCRYSSSFGIVRSSAIANPSLGRCMLISAVVSRVNASRNSASNAGRTKGSKRRSTLIMNDRKSLSLSRKTEPVSARGAGRLVFEFTASERLQELDERRLLVVGQIRSEQVAAVHHQVRALAQVEQWLDQVGEHGFRLVARRIAAQFVQPFENLRDERTDFFQVLRALQRIRILGHQIQVRQESNRRSCRNGPEADAVFGEQRR